jgi:peptidyl-prolyl cis-trans isomerase A (cyclophilin A)
MQSSFRITLLFLLGSICAIAQTQSAPKAAPTHKAAPAAKTAATTASGEPTAVFDTTAGKLRCTLFEKETPETVANFIGLAKGTKDWKNPASHVTKHGVPLYDGTIFHRVIPNFMIQGGDPAGNGSGDPGYTFRDEIVPTLKFDRPGRLAMANSGPNTNGSQFFITEVPTPHLNGRHTIFGQCDDATVALVKQIARMGKDENDRPFRPIKINHVNIERAGSAAAAKPAGGTPAAKPAPKKPGSATPKTTTPQ